MHTRNNIILRKRDVLKRVQLPNGGVFLREIRKSKKSESTAKCHCRPKYRRQIGRSPQRRRRQGLQQGPRIKSVLRNASSLGKKAINSSVGKMVMTEGLKYVPTLHERGTKRIK